LQFDQQYTATTAPLFGAMVAHILRILQSNYQEREDVFLMLDEITIAPQFHVLVSG
jgi:type IV secretion system protein VirD4